jgi:hypothetical protein
MSCRWSVRHAPTPQMAAGDTTVDTGGEFRVHYLFMDPRLGRSALADTFNLADKRRGRLGSEAAEFATSVNVGFRPTMARSVPATDRDSSPPTIHPRQWQSPPDLQFCGSPVMCYTILSRHACKDTAALSPLTDASSARRQLTEVKGSATLSDSRYLIRCP